MIKILYHLGVKQHKRVYKSLYNRSDVIQAITMPSSIDESFKVKDIYKYDNVNDMQSILDRFKPDVFIQCAMQRDFEPMIRERGIKFGFVAHGVFPKSVEVKKAIISGFYKKFDFFCVATRMFREVADEANYSSKVYTNILTQSDILYKKMQKRDEIRKFLIEHSKNPKADKLIVLFGHNCSEKHNHKLLPYHYGYFKSIVELNKMAKDKNWAVYVKPKSDRDSLFISEAKGDWPKINNIRSEYLSCVKNNNLIFLPDSADAYDLYCADTIICSARTTVEVEASMAKRPLVRLWMPSQKLSKDQKSYEYGAMGAKAEYILKDINNLENVIVDSFGNNMELHKRQEEYINDLGLTFDGKASTRFVNAIIDFCQQT